MQRFLAIAGVLSMAAWMIFGTWQLIPIHWRTQRNGEISRESGKAKQLALAAHLYAADHSGRTPNTGLELVPSYLPDGKLLQGTHWFDQRSNSSGVAERHVVAAKMVKYRGDLVAIILAFSDGTIEVLQDAE